MSPRDRGSATNSTNPDKLIEIFARNMRMLRKARELSQEELADLADLDRTYVSSAERQRRNVSLRIIQRVADALEVDVRTLFDPLLRDDVRFRTPPK